jgi:hypothetical protein
MAHHGDEIHPGGQILLAVIEDCVGEGAESLLAIQTEISLCACRCFTIFPAPTRSAIWAGAFRPIGIDGFLISAEP